MAIAVIVDVEFGAARTRTRRRGIGADNAARRSADQAASKGAASSARGCAADQGAGRAAERSPPTARSCGL